MRHPHPETHCDVPLWRKPIGVFVLLLALFTAGGADAGILTTQQRESLAHSKVIGPKVVSALDTAPTERVMIVFAAPLPVGRLHTPALRAIYQATVTAAADDILNLLGNEFVLRRRFQTVNALAGDITSQGLLILAAIPGVLKVDPDESGTGHLVEARALAKIDPVQALGHTGEGVTVAVLDSGLQTSHPDLKDDLVAQQCFCSGGCCPNGADTQSGAGSAEDNNGHGTNVAGIITSKGTIAPAGGAPDASIVAIKVLDGNNSFCCVSDIVAALDWVLNNRPDVDLVNASLGTFALYPGDCDSATADTMALSTAIQGLKDSGIPVFASSGNQASSTAMAAPACVANTISVGAVYDSSFGPSTFGCTDSTTAADKVTCFTNSDSATDLFAPGAPTTSTGMGSGISTYYGTSQASPLAAACAADLMQAHPGMTPAELEKVLKASPARVTDPKNGLSYPRLDCKAALLATEADFYTVAPCRLVDTRSPNGPHGGPALTSGSERAFALAGSCGVPTSAVSVSLNITVVSPAENGHLTLFPGDQWSPSTSSVNFRAGQTQGNNAILRLSMDGNGILAILPATSGGSPVDVILDVNGYFQ
jgi:subtilisin family serine protease